MARPFRWSFARREQLGSWIDGLSDFRPLHDEDMQTLRVTAARILAMSDGADLAFIGRSPENFYDYLSGCFTGLDGTPGLSLVPFSMRWVGEGGIVAIPSHKFNGLSEALMAQGLSPGLIAAAPRPIALVDMIAYGGTMQSVVSVLHRMSQEAGEDWRAVQRRLRIIGLRPRTKNSPKTWRWQQNQDWMDLIPDVAVKNVSAPAGFMMMLAGTEQKVTRSFHAGRWDDEWHGADAPDHDQRLGMALAAHLYDVGASKDEREKLAGLIAAQPQMKQAATRRLVTILRRR